MVFNATWALSGLCLALFGAALGLDTTNGVENGLTTGQTTRQAIYIVGTILSFLDGIGFIFGLVMWCTGGR